VSKMVVRDMEDYSVVIEYPNSTGRLKFDFHICRGDSKQWVYVDSSDKWDDKRWAGHKKATTDGGGKWRIVERATAIIKAQSG
jgi:hypothetical protein